MTALALIAFIVAADTLVVVVTHHAEALHRLAELAQRDREGGQDNAVQHAVSFPSNRNGSN